MRWLAVVVLAGCAPGESSIELPNIAPTSGEPDLPIATSSPYVNGEEALEYVNPMIGTGGVGFAYAGMTPAVQVPLGFLRVGPDTTRGGTHSDQFHHFSGYYFEDPHLRGFSHTHFVGTGTADYGNLRVTFADASRLDVAPRKWWLTKSVGSEVAQPGYYRVASEEGVVAEMTAAHHAAIHRYEVPRGHYLAIDPAASVDDDGIEQTSITVEDGRISGNLTYRGDYVGRRNGFQLFFEGRVDPPPGETIVWDETVWASGAVIEGGRTALAMSWASDAKVLLRFAVSLVSQENAARRYAEIESQQFEAMRRSNRADWAQILDRVQVAGGSEHEREVFYTALYNCFRMPSRLDEYGEYPGLDGAIHDADHPYYTDLSLWDTYRTLHPLWTLAAPDETRNALNSLNLMARDGGYMPRWPAALSYTNGMEGESAALLFAEGASKGIDGVDYRAAFEVLRTSADAPLSDDAPYGGRGGIDDYLTLGWIAADRFSNPASNVLEYSVDDAAMSVLADFLGEAEDAGRYRDRAQSYRNIWDPETRFFRPRNADGSFVEPFSKTRFHERSGDFAEGTAWHYRFYVAHDPAGLIELFGGPEPFIAELDTFMEKSKLFTGDRGQLFIPDPYYWHTNQPPLHVPFLYGSAGRWDLLQHWVGQILEYGYDTTPDGLVGNDDGGTLSAWYVLAASGLFPMVGTDQWFTFEPQFDDVRINGRTPAWYGLEPGMRSHDELF